MKVFCKVANNIYLVKIPENESVSEWIEKVYPEREFHYITSDDYIEPPFDEYDLTPAGFVLNMEKVNNKKLQDYSRKRKRILEELMPEVIDAILDGRSLKEFKDKKDAEFEKIKL